jgi:hypothetical protein
MCDKLQRKLGRFCARIRFYSYDLPHNNCVPKITKPGLEMARYMHTKFHEDWFERSGNIKVTSQKFEKLQCWYYWWQGFIMYAAEMPSRGITFLPSFMKTGTGVQAILRFCLSNLNGCNVNITAGKELWSAALRWGQVALSPYQVSWRLV